MNCLLFSILDLYIIQLAPAPPSCGLVAQKANLTLADEDGLRGCSKTVIVIIIVIRDKICQNSWFSVILGICEQQPLIIQDPKSIASQNPAAIKFPSKIGLVWAEWNISWPTKTGVLTSWLIMLIIIRVNFIVITIILINDHHASVTLLFTNNPLMN